MKTYKDSHNVAEKKLLLVFHSGLDIVAWGMRALLTPPLPREKFRGPGEISKNSTPVEMSFRGLEMMLTVEG
jgi:hypothetical protein